MPGRKFFAPGIAPASRRESRMGITCKIAPTGMPSHWKSDPAKPTGTRASTRTSTCVSSKAAGDSPTGTAPPTPSDDPTPPALAAGSLLPGGHVADLGLDISGDSLCPAGLRAIFFDGNSLSMRGRVVDGVAACPGRHLP